MVFVMELLKPHNFITPIVKEKVYLHSNTLLGYSLPKDEWINQMNFLLALSVFLWWIILIVQMSENLSTFQTWLVNGNFVQTVLIIQAFQLALNGFMKHFTVNTVCFIILEMLMGLCQWLEHKVGLIVLIGTLMSLGELICGTDKLQAM